MAAREYFRAIVELLFTEICAEELLHYQSYSTRRFDPDILTDVLLTDLW